MIEVLIAIVLTTIGLVTLSSLQDTGWKSMAKADYVGRAAGILHYTLEEYEARIANPCYTPVPTGTQTLPPIQTSGGSTAIQGDVTYTVTVTITQIIWDPPGPESYLVTVKVVWPGNTTGISESLEVSRQVSYIFGC